MASPSTPSPPNSSPSSPNPQPPPSSSSDHPPNNLQLAFPISRPPPPQPPPPNPRRLPPPCWSQDETTALIDAYRDKWYTLRRGNLKAPHWQEVADAVSRRCPAAFPSKTAVQCRHKMEKLRKRYRTELQRASSIPVARFISSWVHFQRMEDMEKGPHVAASPSPAPPPPSQVRAKSHFSDDSNDDDDDGDNYFDRDDDGVDGFGGDREYFGSRARSNSGFGVGADSRSVSGLYQNGVGNDSSSANRSGGGFRIKIPTGVPVAQPGGNLGYKKMDKQFLGLSSGSSFGGNGNGNYGSGFRIGNRVSRESRDSGLDIGRGGFGVKREREREMQRLRDPVEEMVGAIKVLGDGFVKMEQMKMEMTREIEASRMEMELKRTEMILESQQRIVEAFARAVWEKRKKAKRMPSPERIDS